MINVYVGLNSVAIAYQLSAQGFYDKRDNSVIMRNWEMGVLFHENASNLLYVGTKADVTVTNENLQKCIFPFRLNA